MFGPIERLRTSLNRIPEEVRNDIVWHCCSALGCLVRKRVPAGFDAEVEHRQPTVDDLCNRLEKLASKGMLLDFLIPAVVGYVVTDRERLSNPEAVRMREFSSRCTLETFEKNGWSDAAAFVQESLREGPRFTEMRRNVAIAGHKILDESFSARYWERWRADQGRL